MTREDVIKGLEHCIEKQDTIVNKNHGFNCIECPYYRRCDNIGAFVGLPLMQDVLKFLKAQKSRLRELTENMIDIATVLRAYDKITSLPDCNDCAKKDCEYMPMWGEPTRYNCPLWKAEVREG